MYIPGLKFKPEVFLLANQRVTQRYLRLRLHGAEVALVVQSTVEIRRVPPD